MQAIFFFLLLIQTAAYCSTTIDADELIVNFKENNAIFKGNVEVRGNIIDLSADSIKVNLLDGDINKIRSIIAQSKSKPINGTLKGKNTNYDLSCQEISFDMVDNIVNATNGTLKNNKSLITGQTIIYNCNSGKITVSGKDKVKILINDESDKKAK
jgi:lipopolysaccharide transport protein LptA